MTRPPLRVCASPRWALMVLALAVSSCARPVAREPAPSYGSGCLAPDDALGVATRAMRATAPQSRAAFKIAGNLGLVWADMQRLVAGESLLWERCIPRSVEVEIYFEGARVDIEQFASEPTTCTYLGNPTGGEIAACVVLTQRLPDLVTLSQVSLVGIEPPLRPL